MYKDGDNNIDCNKTKLIQRLILRGMILCFMECAQRNFTGYQMGGRRSVGVGEHSQPISPRAGVGGIRGGGEGSDH